MDKEDPKKNYDDLFADDSPKMKHKDSQEDDLFADESPKKKSEYSEDLFESNFHSFLKSTLYLDPKDDKPDKHSDMSENSDEFGDSNNQSEANIELEQNKLQG